MKHDFYRLADGVFVGQSFDGSPELLQANTPAGCGAAVGVSDWRAQRINTKTGALVDYKPPAPTDDAMRAWAWDAQAKRWKPSPTLAALKLARTAEVQTLIDAQEARQSRPMRELKVAELAGEPLPQAAADTLTGISAAIKALQVVRASIASAKTANELAAIKLP